MDDDAAAGQVQQVDVCVATQVQWRSPSSQAIATQLINMHGSPAGPRLSRSSVKAGAGVYS